MTTETKGTGTPWEGFPEAFIPEPDTRIRVTTGWNVCNDFATLEEAIVFAAARLAEPVRDPALRRVEIFSCTLEHGAGKASGDVRIELERPAP